MAFKTGYGSGRILEMLYILLAFIMIAVPNLTALTIVFLIVVIIPLAIQRKLSFKINRTGLVFIILFAAYLIGSLLAEDKSIAFKNLEYKLSFLLLPFVLAFQPKGESLRLNRIVLSAILGTTAVMLYGFFSAIDCYSQSSEFLCFQTSFISPIHHPTYFVAYLVFFTFAAWIGWRRKWQGYTLLWIIPYTLTGLLFHFLSLSLSGILFLLLILSVVALVVIYRNLGRIAAGVTILVIPMALYLSVNYIPRIEGEWNGAKWYFDLYIKNPKSFIKSRPETMSGSEERLVLWTVAWQELKEHPFGYGTGSAEDVLAGRLRALSQKKLADKHLNPHNQYLQTGVEIGILGFLILLGLIVYSSVYAIKQRNWLLLLLIGNLAFNCLFESMLQRQSGIVFYTFWVCLLMGIQKFEFEKVES